VKEVAPPKFEGKREGGGQMRLQLPREKKKKIKGGLGLLSGGGMEEISTGRRTEKNRKHATYNNGD